MNGEWVSQGKIGGIDEAPTDGKAYGRKNGDWAEVSDKKYVDDSFQALVVWLHDGAYRD